MKYYSLTDRNSVVDFATATKLGQAPDGGLYFPERIPTIDPDIITSLKEITKETLAFEILKPFVGESIPHDILKTIIDETIRFDFPLIKVDDQISSMELFHGPTLAFKDVGARFMSRCLGYFNRDSSLPTNVLVATSGDTGGAVVDGFSGIAGVRVVVLYPSGKVSAIQELQLTTGGSNVTAIEIDGTFDDCQAIVKRAFRDPSLLSRFRLTSANSINVARWLPQQLYYFFALQQWPADSPPVISVPSGNFGNICAALLAYKSGLPVAHFVAACNSNDVVPRFLSEGNLEIKPTVHTYSNAMDVGNPSNLARIIELFGGNITALKKIVSATSISDQETLETIKSVYRDYEYLLDPHSAVAYAALKKFIEGKNLYGFITATAHPVKFPDVIEKALSLKLAHPILTELSSKRKESISLAADYAVFHQWMSGIEN